MSLEDPEKSKKHSDLLRNNFLVVALMKKMIEPGNLDTSHELGWIEKYGIAIREIVGRNEAGEIRRLISEESYDQAAGLVVEILRREGKI